MKAVVDDRAQEVRDRAIAFVHRHPGTFPSPECLQLRDGQRFVLGDLRHADGGERPAGVALE